MRVMPFCAVWWIITAVPCTPSPSQSGPWFLTDPDTSFVSPLQAKAQAINRVKIFSATEIPTGDAYLMVDVIPDNQSNKASSLLPLIAIGIGAAFLLILLLIGLFISRQRSNKKASKFVSDLDHYSSPFSSLYTSSGPAFGSVEAEFYTGASKKSRIPSIVFSKSPYLPSELFQEAAEHVLCESGTLASNGARLLYQSSGSLRDRLPQLPPNTVSMPLCEEDLMGTAPDLPINDSVIILPDIWQTPPTADPSPTKPTCDPLDPPPPPSDFRRSVQPGKKGKKLHTRSFSHQLPPPPLLLSPPTCVKSAACSSDTVLPPPSSCPPSSSRFVIFASCTSSPSMTHSSRRDSYVSLSKYLEIDG